MLPFFSLYTPDSVVAFEDVSIVFEEETYIISEDGLSQEVCVVPSSTLADGQTISGVLSTVDDSAIGKQLHDIM